MQAIAQGKIDNPVFSAEGNRRFCAISREWLQPLAGTSCQDDCQNVLFHARRIGALIGRAQMYHPGAKFNIFDDSDEFLPVCGAKFRP
jgi:hypothetical protein